MYHPELLIIAECLSLALRPDRLDMVFPFSCYLLVGTLYAFPPHFLNLFGTLVHAEEMFDFFLKNGEVELDGGDSQSVIEFA